MTNLSPDVQRPSATRAIRFAIDQRLKGLNTCLPGLIDSYDPVTRRASVDVAIPLVSTNGDHIERGVIPDVPVLFPGGGGYFITFPLSRGEPVLLLFAQRGMSGFKKSHGKAPPDGHGFWSLRDAVAVPGFGPVTIDASKTDGLTIRNADATSSIEIDAAGVRAKSGESSIGLSSEGVRATFGTSSIDLNLAGIRIATSGDIDIVGANVNVTETD